MLIEMTKVMPLLRCPTLHAPLHKNGNRLVSEKNDLEYGIIDGYPIIVDFKKSILTKENTSNIDSLIERPKYKGLSGTIKKILLPPSQATKANISLLLSAKNNPRVLIIGGGTPGQSMEPFYDNLDIDLVSFDIYASKTVQFVADAHDIPLADESFDIVIIQAILEHVLYPEKVVSEIYRVLKNNGLVYAETPFMQHVHEGAYDFTRYTESGHRFLFKNFSTLKSGTTAGAGTQLQWAIEYFTRGISRSRLIGKLAKLAFFWLQYLDRAIPKSYNIDAASGVFFLGKKASQPISDEDIVKYYSGAQ